jgi:hypothetical protein
MDLGLALAKIARTGQPKRQKWRDNGKSLGDSCPYGIPFGDKLLREGRLG